MSARKQLVFVVAAILGCTSWSLAAFVTPVKSDFKNDLDGWTILDASQGNFVWSGPAKGNPPGAADYTDQTSLPGIIRAPAKYLGDWSSLDGVGTLSWEHKIFKMDKVRNLVQYEAWISGPGGEANFKGGLPPVNPALPIPHPANPSFWEPVVVPIEETSWTVTSGDWSNLLSNVTDLRIRIECVANLAWFSPPLPGDNEVIDNIVLTPEPSALLLFVFSGLAVLKRRGRC